MRTWACPQAYGAPSGFRVYGLIHYAIGLLLSLPCISCHVPCNTSQRPARRSHVCHHAPLAPLRSAATTMPCLNPPYHILYCLPNPAGAQAAMLRARVRQLLAEVRPDAVALVDAFGFEDYALNSALGRYDGDVYCALLEMAQVHGDACGLHGWLKGLVSGSWYARHVLEVGVHSVRPESLSSLL